MLHSSLTNNGLLNIFTNGKAENSDQTHHDNVYFDLNKNEQQQQNQKVNSSLINVSFTTELYAEIIDGIYQEKKTANLNSFNSPGSCEFSILSAFIYRTQNTI